MSRAAKAVKRAARLAAAPPVAGPPGEVAEALAPALLARVALALNDCERAGLTVELAHGAVLSDAGYVFRIVVPHKLNTAGETWQVRSRMLTEFPQTAGGGDLDD